MQAWLESLDDEAWSTYEREAGLYEEPNGPIVTGDPELDALERDAWEEELERRGGDV